jgi:branched-chain amino acid transport system substrate-binding protein
MTFKAMISAIVLASTLSCATAVRAEDLRIGLAAPLSRGDAVFGAQLRLGATQAIADLDAAGGFLGKPATLVTADDIGDPKAGVEVAKTFVRSGVDLVLGDFSSAVTVPASAIYAEAGVLDITPSAMAPSITGRGLPTIFRLCAREDGQAAIAADYLLRRHYANIAIVHDRTATGKALADGVRAALAARGVPEVYYGSFAAETRDLSTLINRLRAAGSQIVVWGGAPAGAALLVRQLKATQAEIPLLGGLAIASDDFATPAGDAADGTLTIFPRDPRTRPEAGDLLRRWKASGTEAFGYAFYSYAAIQIIQQASEAAHSLQPKTLAATLHSGMTFQTVLGPLAFDANGDPTTSDLTIYVWHKGPSGRMGFSDLAGS